MKTTALLATLAALLAPGFAAAGCSYHEQTAQMSCAEGSQWDEKTEACVPVTG